MWEGILCDLKFVMQVSEVELVVTPDGGYFYLIPTHKIAELKVGKWSVLSTSILPKRLSEKKVFMMANELLIRKILKTLVSKLFDEFQKRVQKN